MKSERRSFKSRSAPFVLGTAAFLFYALTAARTIQWQDSAQFTYRICSGTLWNEYGLAMVHPLHFWLGRLMLWVFPGPDPWAVSLVSALGGAAAVGLLYACVRRLTGKESAALFASLTLMLAHSFWRFSGLPEVYTLSAALLLGEVWCYLRLKPSANGEGRMADGKGWWLLFFLNGLGLANHNLALLSTAVWGITFLIWAYRRREKGERRKEKKADPGRGWNPFWQLVPIAFFWILGALPYFLIIFLELKHRPAGEVIHSALFGEGFKSQVTGLLPTPGILLITLGFMLLSFPGAAWLLALKGMADGGWRKTKGVSPCNRAFSSNENPKGGNDTIHGLTPFVTPFVWIAGIHLLFFLRYNVIDQYTFLIPVYGLIALLAGVGFASLSPGCWRKTAWCLLFLQPVFYAAVPALVRQSGVLATHERHKPYRDDYEYLFLPWQVQERSAERLMQEAFDVAGGKGILVVEDSMAVYTAAWMRMHQGLEETVVLRRPEDVDVAHLPAGTVWIPKRSDQPPPDGWSKTGEVWVRGPRSSGG